MYHLFSISVTIPLSSYEHFWLGGEITTYHKSDRHHVYLTLEDEGFSIRCMVWSNDLKNIDFPLSKGILVDVYGTLAVYDRQAQVQIQVEKIRLVDKKDAQFDTDVIQHLEERGLLPRQKQDLPSVIRRIALITSKNSAAVEDFRSTFYKHGGTAQIDILDVLLQGEQAATTIVEAINRANQMKQIDVIVLTRGGGRHIDLSVFNDYRIAEAICLSKIPVITGIGHEQDDTIADRVADESSITPTGAAIELAKLSVPTLNTTAESDSPTPIEPLSMKNQASPLLLNRTIMIIGIMIIILLTILVIRSF
ncbi:MAG: exodeoxyribonuclease VII large subunit [Anaerolineae bacterium]|nr:exodeoxyribonuclease VII large subunit [Anaerolineae bacterium]